MGVALGFLSMVCWRPDYLVSQFNIFDRYEGDRPMVMENTRLSRRTLESLKGRIGMRLETSSFRGLAQSERLYSCWEPRELRSPVRNLLRTGVAEPEQESAGGKFRSRHTIWSTQYLTSNPFPGRSDTVQRGSLRDHALYVLPRYPALFTHPLHEDPWAKSDGRFGPAYWAVGMDETSRSYIFKVAVHNITGSVPSTVTFEGILPGTPAQLILLTGGRP